MNAIFTIAAKNYLAQAKTLGESVKKYCPDYDFYICLSDDIDGNDSITKEPYNIIQGKDIGIPFYKEMAYKYEVVEFCTSIKPFVFNHLFKKHGYEHIFYLDPDMMLCHDLSEGIEALKDEFLLITPHIMKPYLNYEGSISEEELLFVGIYNLGFAAIRYCQQAEQFLAWWEQKLKDKCYADKQDALHVDQRWLDFAPALYEKGVKIFRHPGYNIAVWNLHERSVAYCDDKYIIDDKFPMVIFHFSGFDPNNPNLMCKKQSKFTLEKYPYFKPLFDEYLNLVLKNGFQSYSKLTYAYNKYNNGIAVVRYQRRFYRALLKKGFQVEDPFSTVQGSYYDLLKKNKLLIYEKGKNLDITRNVISNYKDKMNIMFKLLYLFKRIIGIKRYYFLMRFFLFYSRFEEQLFLIKDKNGKDWY